VDTVDVALLVVRIVFGVTLALHGYNKIAKGVDGTARWFAGIGMRWPKQQAVLAAVTEITAGLAFAAGLFTPVVSAAIIGVMAVAYWVDHRGKGLFIFNNGWEYVLSISAVALAVAIAGPGRISIDHALGTDIHGLLIGIIAVAVGVLTATAQLAVSYRPPPT
jgi:putative oxidoreductase